MAVIHHRYAEIEGHRLFYREAGPANAPTLVLLHGYPTSSHMFRGLIPLLAEEYRVIAPDHLGFGLSDAPGVEDFEYTFDALAHLTAQLLARLGITRYAIYVHDYGAPIGWRLALSDAKAITAIVSQNGNAYEDGFVESFWESIWAYAERQDAETERALRPALSQQAIRWQYLTGVPDPTLVDPTTWRHDAALIARPGNDRIQLRLFRDYASNRPLYPRLQEYFRSSQVPLLALWGRGDEIFGPAGAEAFARDLPEARIELWDTGHFLLETHLNEAAATIREFLGEAVGRGRAEGAPTAGH